MTHFCLAVKLIVPYYKTMLSAQDIKKITAAIEERLENIKQIFYTKPEMDEKFSQVLTSIDSLSRDKVVRDQEMTIRLIR